MPVPTIEKPGLSKPENQEKYQSPDTALEAGGLATSSAEVVSAEHFTASEMLHPEALEQRVDDAMEACDFRETPELRRGVESFYREHYELGADLETMLEEDPAAVDKSGQRIAELNEIANQSIENVRGIDIDYLGPIIESGNMPPQISSIIRPYLAMVRLKRIENPGDEDLQKAELMLMATAATSLFSEASVAVTTIGDNEKQTIESLCEKVLDKTRESGLFTERGDTSFHPEFTSKAGLRRSINMYGLKDPLQGVTSAEELFWKDTRHSGQLLFHNSGDMLITRSGGKLMPRRMQARENGDTRMQSAERVGDRIHAPTIHWSEHYDATGYKGGSNPGTIAVPMRKIIETAPYARDAQYGELQLKPGRNLDGKVHVSDTTGTIGAGQPDYQGGYGIDRTFYSSATDAEPDAPLEEAPDGHVFELDRHDFAVVKDDNEQRISELSGLGEGFPQPVRIEGFVPARRDMSLEEANERSALNKQATERAIKELQAESIARYTGIIVPIRAGGVLDFYVHDDANLPYRPNARFSQVAE